MCGCGSAGWSRRQALRVGALGAVALPFAATAVGREAALQVAGGRLVVAGRAVPFLPSPSVGGVLRPRFVVLHYTETVDPGTALDWLTRQGSRVSAHLVIDRAGRVVQLVPLDRVAWHAGDSVWGGVDGLNRHAIGIEFVNAGPLTRRGGRWCAGPWPVAEAEVVADAAGDRWQDYPEAQIEAGLRIVTHLIADLPQLEDALAHSEIAPRRRRDPGGAFPMGRFRRVFGTG